MFQQAFFRLATIHRFVTLALGIAAAALGASPALAAAKRKPNVLLVYAGDTLSANDVVSKLGGTEVFGTVQKFNATSQTPSLAQLLPYDAVLVASLAITPGFQDPAALGNNLADYVDAGGGVVTMPVSINSLTNSAPAGRWNPGYLSMPVAATIAGGSGTVNLLSSSITDPNHPILTGVATLSCASQSRRAHVNLLAPGATLLASYNDGIMLASAGPLPGRADLNFFPASSTISSSYWSTSTDGAKLMANALLYTMRPRVAIVNDIGPEFLPDIKSKIRATGLIGIVDFLQVGSPDPSLEDLMRYDAVLTNLWISPSANFGNILADYVDAGGGVVVTQMSLQVNYAIHGRWSPDYELIAPANPYLNTLMGAIDYPDHPVMAGVNSVKSINYAIQSTTLRPDAYVIARYANNLPFVVGSTRHFNRIDLGMNAFSSSVGSGWDASTDGGRLMANALVAVCKPYVACVAADYTSGTNDVRAKLLALRRFSGVSVLNAVGAPPSADALRPFGAVLTYSNLAYGAPDVLGNRLADFVDAGGGVVVAPFATLDTGDSTYLLGRWATGGYDIAPGPLPGMLTGPATLGARLDFVNPINRFVRKFDGGTSSWRQASNPLLRGRELLEWNDGRMLASIHNFRKRVDLGFVPFSSAADSNAWNQRTDGSWLMANALEYVVYHKPCAGDFDGDGLVDDNDFVSFAYFYNNLIDPRGDLTGDELTDDSDFVVFASGYDALVCP
ncbi:MAG: hypothetical protein U0570_04255 [Phycisphaerales bacterium]